MRKNILASIATMLVIVSGVLTPLFGLVINTFETKTVSAQQQGATTFDGESPGSSTTTTTQLASKKPASTNITSADLCKNDASFTCSFMSAVSEIITFVPLTLATVSGMFFDFSIWNSIQSGTYTQYDQYDSADPSSEGLVVKGWKLVRDFTNLLFIFALFVVAFTLILDLDGGGKVSMTSNPKRTLARVLMMALLVNFSFFLGRVVIDTTNKLALQFYSNMNNAPQIGNMVGTNSTQTTELQKYYGDHPEIHSIATGIISNINPQKFMLDTSGAKVTAQPGRYAELFFLSLTAAFFGLFLTYIFISIGILFIGRTVGLYLAIIISPLAFVSYTVPFLQKQPYIGFDDWMKQFLGLAFMAPIFLFFIYIGIQFFKLDQGAGGGSTSNAAIILFKFAMVAMFFTLAKKISKDMSGKIGDMATGLVTGAVTSVMTIGAAAVTGGASAAFVATRQQATRGLTSMSNQVLGEDRTDAIRQRMGGLKSFRNLPNDRRAAVTGLATMLTGSKVPGQINAAITDGQGIGAKINRVNNIKNIREERIATEEAAAKKKIEDAQKAKDAAEAEAKKQTTRTTYNYDQRKAAMDAKNAQTGPKPTFGDGSAKMKDSDFSPKQQERILNKAIAAEAKRGGGQPESTQNTSTPTTSATDGTTRPKNNFNGAANFDRPQTTASANAAQKAESENLTRIYQEKEQQKKDTVHVDNLDVKNLKVNPNEAHLPSRNSNTSVTPQTQAATLLSGIQMTPRASSGALNYKSSDFKEKDSPTNSNLVFERDTNGALTAGTKGKERSLEDVNRDIELLREDVKKNPSLANNTRYIEAAQSLSLERGKLQKTSSGQVKKTSVTPQSEATPPKQDPVMITDTSTQSASSTDVSSGETKYKDEHEILGDLTKERYALEDSLMSTHGYDAKLDFINHMSHVFNETMINEQNPSRAIEIQRRAIDEYKKKKGL